MKKFSTEIKRVLSMLLALMLVFSIVAEPGGMLLTRANSEGETSSVVSTPVYTHSMDTRNENNAESTLPGNVSDYHSSFLPLGWTYRVANAIESKIVVNGDRTYYHMETAGKTTDAWAYYQYGTSEGKASVLSYEVMVDNTAVTDSWTVYAPILAATNGSRTVDLKIIDNVLTYAGTGGPLTMTLTPGQWYRIEMLCVDKALKIFVDGTEFVNVSNHYGVRNAASVNFINMGMCGTAENTQVGADARIGQHNGDLCVLGPDSWIAPGAAVLAGDSVEPNATVE